MRREQSLLESTRSRRRRLTTIDDLARSMRRANGLALARHRPVTIPDKRRASARNACRGPAVHQAQGR
ncbi:MAG: hypothetical protein ACYCST_15945 [Acidimicrobiales bacterium]